MTRLHHCGVFTGPDKRIIVIIVFRLFKQVPVKFERTRPVQNCCCCALLRHGSNRPSSPQRTRVGPLPKTVENFCVGLSRSAAGTGNYMPETRISPASLKRAYHTPATAAAPGLLIISLRRLLLSRRRARTKKFNSAGTVCRTIDHGRAQRDVSRRCRGA